MDISVGSSMMEAKCRICGKEFKTPDDARQHEWDSHAEKNWQECTTCGFWGPDSYALRQHMRDAHGRFVCSNGHSCVGRCLLGSGVGTLGDGGGNA